MEPSKLKILLVTNSVPLPATDFLKYKIIGLSKVFDLHLMCWDSENNKQAFLQKYPGALRNEQIHLGYKLTGLGNILHVLLHVLLAFMQYPGKTLRLFNRVRSNNNGSKKIIHQFLLYLPIMKLNPDIVHFEFGTLAYSFRDIKDYISCKASTSFRGYDMNFTGVNDPQYYSKVWQAFDGFHFLGKDLRQRALSRGYRGDKVEALIPPAIDTSVFNNPENGIDQRGKLIILSTGRLIWKKGYEYGIQAAAILRERNIPFEYRIIGDGEYREALEFTIAELGLQQHVRLLGAKTAVEIKEALADADVFLHPAITEGFCNAVLEAQAMGIPAIVSDAGGLAENVADGETGYVVPKWDAAALADKLEWCWQNPEAARMMGKNGVERVKKHFRLEDQLLQFQNFYEMVYRDKAGSIN